MPGRRVRPASACWKSQDIITCHVPLTRQRTGRHRFHLLDAVRLARLRRGAILVNAARGPVVETDALRAVLDSGRVGQAVIDCWEGEPAYRPDLLARAALSTPHIAGHAYEGKVNGTAIVYRRACDFLGEPAAYPFTLPEPPLPLWRGDAAGRGDEAVLRELVLAVYDIEADSNRLAASCAADDAARAAAFDAQRSRYPMRREFASTRVQVAHASDALLAKIAGLGFRLV